MDPVNAEPRRTDILQCPTREVTTKTKGGKEEAASKMTQALAQRDGLLLSDWSMQNDQIRVGKKKGFGTTDIQPRYPESTQSRKCIIYYTKLALEYFTSLTVTLIF